MKNSKLKRTKESCKDLQQQAHTWRGENCMCGSCLLVSELPPGIKLKIYISSRKSSINHILFPPIVEM